MVRNGFCLFTARQDFLSFFSDTYRELPEVPSQGFGRQYWSLLVPSPSDSLKALTFLAQDNYMPAIRACENAGALSESRLVGVRQV